MMMMMIMMMMIFDVFFQILTSLIQVTLFASTSMITRDRHHHHHPLHHLSVSRAKVQCQSHLSPIPNASANCICFQYPRCSANCIWNQSSNGRCSFAPLWRAIIASLECWEMSKTRNGHNSAHKFPFRIIRLSNGCC